MEVSLGKSPNRVCAWPDKWEFSWVKAPVAFVLGQISVLGKRPSWVCAWPDKWEFTWVRAPVGFVLGQTSGRFLG